MNDSSKWTIDSSVYKIHEKWNLTAKRKRKREAASFFKASLRCVQNCLYL